MDEQFLTPVPGVAIPIDDVLIRASRSSGPGGQHANVTASRIEAVLHVDRCDGLDAAQRRRVIEHAGPIVRAVAQDTRSQLRNRELALERLEERLAAALERRRPRVPTRPSRAAKRNRLESKRARSRVKRDRRPPAAD